MPRKRSAIPPLYHHKPTNQAKSRLNGRDYYLGVWGSPEAEEAYRRLVAEALANPTSPPGPSKAIAGPTVTEVVLAYTRHRSEDGTSGVGDNERLAIKQLRSLYGREQASAFGPLKLIALRKAIIASGVARSEVNRRILCIKRMFRWAASMELIPGAAWQSLDAVKGLRQGEAGARETEPIGPVPDSVVEATIRELSPMLAALVRFLRLTGCRLGEACSMRPRAIVKLSSFWVYRPESHKTQHRGKDRVIRIGPRAIAAIEPFLEGIGPDDLIFTPARAMEERARVRRLKRRTRIQPSQAGPRHDHAPREYSPCYNRQSVRQAIVRACDRAGVPRWHPHQLRHSCATELRSRYGPEYAKAVLGHSSLKMTDRYAELDGDKAVQAMREIG